MQSASGNTGTQDNIQKQCVHARKGLALPRASPSSEIAHVPNLRQRQSLSYTLPIRLSATSYSIILTTASEARKRSSRDTTGNASANRLRAGRMLAMISSSRPCAAGNNEYQLNSVSECLNNTNCSAGNRSVISLRKRRAKNSLTVANKRSAGIAAEIR